MRSVKWSWVLRTIAFLLVFAVLFFVVGSAFGVRQYAVFMRSRGIAKEKRGSLDGIYIGASNVHCFWQPLFGWNEYGISVYNYAFSAMPVGAVRSLIEALRQRQPDALYIVNLNQFRNEKNTETVNLVPKLHSCVDYFPVSIARARLISGLADAFELSQAEQLELHFPIIAFHSDWNKLKKWAMGAEVVDYKGSGTAKVFLGGRSDLSGKYNYVDKRMSVDKAETAVLDDLLDYADRSGTRLLFVKVPQAIARGKQSYLNLLEDRVRERGFPCLDLLEGLDQTGIDLRWDFFNSTHTNVHGSLKFSRALSKYLVENYGFADKRGAPGWESWDEAAGRYAGITGGYLLPVEWTHTLQKDIDAPVIDAAVVQDSGITVSWSASGEADGYQIYRKDSRTGDQWALVGETDAQTLSWRDDNLPPAKYTYTVIAYRGTGDELSFGSFDAKGVSASIEGDEAMDDGLLQEGVPGDDIEDESVGEEEE